MLLYDTTGSHEDCLWVEMFIFLKIDLTTSWSPATGLRVLPSGFGAFGSAGGAKNRWKTQIRDINKTFNIWTNYGKGNNSLVTMIYGMFSCSVKVK